MKQLMHSNHEWFESPLRLGLAPVFCFLGRVSRVFARLLPLLMLLIMLSTGNNQFALIKLKQETLS
ncbi:hypothetical protein ACCUM_4164 [Candidatus Accumulibacter phosphatis]|uniref:Uncharacterized protein n=1 Tax=Candidatus Accumulibacter phosphatis TaxID=327160 RepID=A0A5S4EH45_9PROT|nr:hypothetical protein ACCUM_4164 [Candidatus Accumulibacter phosphatis]